MNLDENKNKKPDQSGKPDSSVENQFTKVYEIMHEDPQETEKKHRQRIKTQRRKRTFATITAVLAVLVLIEAIVGVTGLLITSQIVRDSQELNINDFISQESSLIYDDQGQVITEIGVYFRENIDYDDCPESLIDAFLAIEDSRFFTHFGFDIPRFSKAIIENLKNRNFGQGGSTFTMQLVKNTYFSVDAGDASRERKKSIEYKIQQIYLSILLEQHMNKKDIFQLYLNKLNFGGRIRGVQRAAMYYFGKNCNELSLPESAMLAGIVNLPNGYNPYFHLDEANKRRNEVLYQMLNHGYITNEEYQLASSIRVENLLVGETRDVTENSQYQSYIDAALDEAERLTGEDPTLKGMQIYTNMNRTVQDQIEQIQNGQSSVIFPDELMQVAMVSMNNQTGAIIGIGGGRNYDGARLLNRATMNFKQPGSAVKPILSYALAFECLGYSLDEVLVDKPSTYPMESMVLVNATGKYEGDVTLKDAVGWSLNIPAILTLEKVTDKIGRDKVASYMNSIGFSKVTKENFHLSFAIGGTLFETTVTELAGAHSMIFNNGVYNEPHTISKVVMQDGTEYYPPNQNRKVLSSGSAWLTAQLMENNVSGPYINFMQLLRRSYPVYAKTGTTDWGRDGLAYGIPRGQMKDKWMVSSTSNYTNCAWVGYDMAIAGKETYYTRYKTNLNIPGNINRLLLDAEENIPGYSPKAVERPTDVTESRYVYGTYPHVRQEAGITDDKLITSLVSSAGLEAQPLVSTEEYLATLDNSFTGISASYDQYGVLNVSWGTSSGLCSGGQKNISLHDQWGNDIDQWGTCLVDLSWLSGAGNAFWATVYCDDSPVGSISSSNGSYNGWIADLWGTVKVCGSASDSSETYCSVAAYNPTADAYWENGWWDGDGVFHPNE